MSGWVAGAVVVSGAVNANASKKASKAQTAAASEASRLQSDAGVRAAEIQASAARDSARIQQRIAEQQMALEREQFNRQLELQQPFHTAGVNALNQLVPLASNYTPFGTDQFKADPGYSFRMDEGMKALERSAAARGGLLSGGAMKGIQRFSQGLASDEYSNAFNRYQIERNARLNPLQSLAGAGQTSAGQIGQAGQAMTSGIGQAGQALASGMTGINQNMASNLGNIYTSTAGNLANNAMSAANARASGYVGQANALNSALSTGLNFYQGQQMMNMLKPTTTPMTYGGG